MKEMTKCLTARLSILEIEQRCGNLDIVYYFTGKANTNGHRPDY